MPFALRPMRSDVVALRYALCATLFLILFPSGSNAQGLFQGISGSLEYNYSFFDSETKDVSGNKTKTKSHNHNPRFTLDIDTKIYPNLRLHAGGVAEANISDVKTEGIEIDTRATRFRPYVDLTLETPLYTAGMGYSRREEKTKVEDSPSVTLVNEEYYSILEWRPDGFPSSRLSFQRRNRFDERERFQDIKEDYLELFSKYAYKGLDLNYRGTYTNTQDDIRDLDTRQQVHDGRVAYTDAFFDKRVFLSTNYHVTYQQTKTDSKGRGTVQFPIFPFGGLFSIDQTPEDSTDVPMISNSALIDGDVATSSGIDIGLPAIGDPTDPRNIGLDLLNVTEVNQLLVWIDRDLSSNLTIANSFSWQIWTSPDNTTWNLFTTISPAPFGPFQNRFELNFSNVNTRYIKVVVSPLSPAVPGAASFPDILITELQAFVTRPAEGVEGKTENTSHTYNLDVRTRIFDAPLLFYELNYFFNRVENSSDEQRYDLSNAFSVNHRLSRMLVGSARVGVENGEERDERRLAYVYNVSLTADPLRTLHHSIVLSGRDEELGGEPNDNYSAFLYNTAGLYNGIDVNLNGGVSFTNQETGKTRDFIIDVGANIVPHPAVVFVLNYSDRISKRWGGERRSDSTYTSILDMRVNYNPFRTLNLFASWEIIWERHRDTETTQDYALNWSPFPDGALQFNFAYDENLRSQDNLKERILTPSIRWNITKRSYLDISYQITRSKNDLQEIDSKFLGTTLKIFF